jgi:protein-S-isoprenylcysteine O-methyltransferase Ste14
VDAFRHALALLLVVSAPPAFGLWLAIHPFVRFWRRLGPRRTWLILGGVTAAAMAGLWRARAVLLAVDFGTSWAGVALGVPILALAIGIAVRVRAQLRLTTQMGFPELAPETHPQPLLCEGVYGRMRHPRYVGAWLGMLGWALVANHLATWVLWALSPPLLHAVVLLEERELRERYGPAWDDYARRVPRYVPQRRAARLR